MLTSIKNGQMAKKSIIFQKRKKICEALLKVLWDEGFIAGYKICDGNIRDLEIFLKYSRTGEPAIKYIKFISKPSKKVFLSAKQIWKIDSSKSFIIFSTNKGIKSITQCKKDLIGGEALLIIK